MSKDNSNKNNLPPIRPSYTHVIQGETTNFNRLLKVDVHGIAKRGTRFKLENGYYTNEEDTILLKSSERTGKFFEKERTVEKQA